MTLVVAHFDLLCPWAYQGSLWIKEAAVQRGLDLEWRFFSLEERNWQSGQKHPWERPWSFSWSLLRIAAYARREFGGNEGVEAFYRVAGRHLHEDGRPAHTPDGARAVVEELGWGAGVVDTAIADQSTTADVLAEHRAAVEAGVYGVPSFVVDGHLLFGPVVARAPRGEAAGRLWDAVLTLAQTPTLYEVQRPKSEIDQTIIADAFAPYAQATAETHRPRRSDHAT